jgi:NAD(P)-dependent dehydrogenase (short-subunit alcohol dehydrogenase family)
VTANEFQNKNILITGAGRGIGKRMALSFAKAGARIGLLGRTKAEIDLAHIEIEQHGGNAFRIQADVTKFDELSCAIERATSSPESAIDVLICAAGIPGPLAPLVETSMDAWANTYQTNVLGVVHSCRAVLPSMIKNRRGKIIVLACGSDRGARFHFSAYETSKIAAVRFVEGLSLELLDLNVQINCLDPGAAYTTLTDEIIKAEEHLDPRDVEEAREIRRTGGCSPERQFQLAAFLASEDSNHITGKLIHLADDWRKLKNNSLREDVYTLRRVSR